MRKYLQGYLKNIPGPEIMFQDLDLLICLFLHLGPEKKTHLIKINSSRIFFFEILWKLLFFVLFISILTHLQLYLPRAIYYVTKKFL